MPNILLPIRNLRSSVERPVVYSVLRQLMEDTRISNLTPIRFYGDEQNAVQTGSTINGSNSGNAVPIKNSGERDRLGVNRNRWPFSEQVTIEVEEDTSGDFVSSSMGRHNDGLPIFYDPALGISIKPVYEIRDVTIRIKYRASDKNQAEMWRNNLRIQSLNQEELHLHEASYHYGFSIEYQNLLMEIHRLREKVAPYGEELGLYVSKHLAPTVSVVANFNGQENALVVAETLGRIQGRFDFSSIAEKAERDGEQSAWSVSCSYLFSYSKPVSLAARYPIMVHNQLIDAKWRYNKKTKNISKTNVKRPDGLAALDGFESDSQLLDMTSNDGLQIPAFDEFKPSDVVTSSIRCLTGLVGLSPIDLRDLFSLKDLGSYNFDQNILNFLKSERQYITRPFQSVFTLNLYRDSGMQRRPGLVLDENLNIRTLEDLDLRGQYHIRLGLITDFGLLSSDAIKRLKNNYPATVRVVKAIDGALKDKGGVKDITKNQLTIDELLSVGIKPDGSYDQATPPDYSMHPGSGRTVNNRSMFLVESLFVATRPMRLLSSEVSNEIYHATQYHVK